MSEIPSDIPASAAQAGFQAREVGKEREAHRVGNADAGNRQIKSLDEADATVETTDNDTRVFSDAEGGGSLGRQPEQESADHDTDSAADGQGITRDNDGQLHLDIEI
jgi:hypothetical protein